MSHNQTHSVQARLREYLEQLQSSNEEDELTKLLIDAINKIEELETVCQVFIILLIIIMFV